MPDPKALAGLEETCREVGGMIGAEKYLEFVAQWERVGERRVVTVPDEVIDKLAEKVAAKLAAAIARGGIKQPLRR